MKTFAWSPALAAYAAIALPALPAVGIESTCAPSRAALVTAADKPRALKELVGFGDSSLMNSRSRPTARPRRGARSSGVHPSPSVIGSSSAKSGITSRYRHIVASREASDARGHVRAAEARSYRASRGAPHEHKCWIARASYGPAPHGTEHSR